MQTPDTAKIKSDPGSRSSFSKIFDSGFERKMQNLGGVNSGTSDPWPLLISDFFWYWWLVIVLASSRSQKNASNCMHKEFFLIKNCSRDADKPERYKYTKETREATKAMNNDKDHQHKIQ